LEIRTQHHQEFYHLSGFGGPLHIAKEKDQPSRSFICNQASIAHYQFDISLFISPYVFMSRK